MGGGGRGAGLRLPEVLWPRPEAGEPHRQKNAQCRRKLLPFIRVLGVQSAGTWGGSPGFPGPTQPQPPLGAWEEEGVGKRASWGGGVGWFPAKAPGARPRRAQAGVGEGVHACTPQTQDAGYGHPYTRHCLLGGSPQPGWMDATPDGWHLRGSASCLTRFPPSATSQPLSVSAGSPGEEGAGAEGRRP